MLLPERTWRPAVFRTEDKNINLIATGKNAGKGKCPILPSQHYSVYLAPGAYPTSQRGNTGQGTAETRQGPGKPRE